MRSGRLTYSLRIGLIVATLLTVAGGRAYATLNTYVPAPLLEPTPSPAPSPTAVSTTSWLGRELDPIIIEGGWGGIVRVWVRGQSGLPVTIRSADGGWSTVNFVGTKLEYGPDALEFAPVWPGRYTILPQGLGASLTIDLAPGHIAQVLFEPAKATPPPTPATSPTPKPTPTPTMPRLVVPATLAPAPSLVEPPDGTAISIKARLDLTWEWDGTLGPNDYFQVEIWNNYNEFRTPIDVAWVKASTYKYDSNPNPAYGVEYRWKITVIRGIPAREKVWSTPENQVWEPSDQTLQVSEQSETWVLIVDVPCPPGSRIC